MNLLSFILFYKIIEIKYIKIKRKYRLNYSVFYLFQISKIIEKYLDL
jgi:hypothetical protein